MPCRSPNLRSCPSLACVWNRKGRTTWGLGDSPILSISAGSEIERPSRLGSTGSTIRLSVSSSCRRAARGTSWCSPSLRIRRRRLRDTTRSPTPIPMLTTAWTNTSKCALEPAGSAEEGTRGPTRPTKSSAGRTSTSRSSAIRRTTAAGTASLCRCFCASIKATTRRSSLRGTLLLKRDSLFSAPSLTFLPRP